ncbi:MAG: YbjN domain-containing protein, partial [Streptomyces sp.]
SWVRASIEFDKWLVEQFGLEKDADSGDDEGSGTGTNGSE